MFKQRKSESKAWTPPCPLKTGGVNFRNPSTKMRRPTKREGKKNYLTNPAHFIHKTWQNIREKDINTIFNQNTTGFLLVSY